MANPLAQALMLPSQRDDRLLDRIRHGQGLVQQGSSTEPVQHWAQGLARVLQAGMGGYMSRRAQEEGKERDTAYQKKLAGVLRNPDPMGALAASDDPELQGLGLQYQLAQASEPGVESWKTLSDQEEQALGLPPAGVYEQSTRGATRSVYDAPKAEKPNVQEFFVDGKRVKGYLDKNNQLVQVGEGAPLFAPQQPVAANLITLVAPDGKTTRSLDSRDPAVKTLASEGWIERQTSMFPAAPSGYMYTPQGLAHIPGGPADPANPTNITGEQRKVGSFAERLDSANKIIDENEAVGTEYVQEGLSNIPLVGTMLASPEKQKLNQAQRDFINAQLRRESGATIQDTEFESAAKQYFPQPGEGEEIVRQKREARRIAIENMRREAGAALPTAPSGDDYDSLYGLTPTN